jgi:ATP-dependent DNA ligase
VILDGEAVVYVVADDGSVHISFAAAQSRALSRPRSARELADQHPATYVAFDLLGHPAAGLPDLRPRPYTERRQVFLDVLADVGPPIVPVWSTTDLDEALLWFETLEGRGVEGIVAKPLRSAYKAGRVWAKVRHANAVDATVVGLHRQGPASEGARRTAARRTGDAVPAADHGTRVRRRPAPGPPLRERPPPGAAGWAGRFMRLARTSRSGPGSRPLPRAGPPPRPHPL